ncbi:MAG: TIM barrel protein [Prevotellaceae bacterium]|nr:TIM barrel protein [Prevotellaceae bacterium]
MSNNLSRRSFLGTSAALAAGLILPSSYHSLAGLHAQNPHSSRVSSSDFGGVQIGAITYSWRSMPGGLENIIKYCRACGISSIELMSGDLEAYMGAPANPRMGFPRSAGGGRPQLTEEQQAAVAKYPEDLKKWRLSLDMSKVAAAKKLLDDAGIKAHIVKFSPARWSDEETDYAFKVAKAMGAKGVTEEVGEAAVKRLAPFAEKHGMYAIFHNHMQFAEPGFDYDKLLAVSPAVRMNFDAGHYFGSTGRHPNEIIEKYHDRIVSIHIKDKTGPDVPEVPNTNQVWGQGQMPLSDVLLLIKKEKWPIYCDIELEYEIKPWSDAVKEVANCVHFARQILI